MKHKKLNILIYSLLTLVLAIGCLFGVSSFVGNSSLALSRGGEEIYVGTSATFNVKSGTIGTTGKDAIYNDGILNITGGTINGNIKNNGTINYTAGTINGTVTLAKGKYITLNANPTSTIKITLENGAVGDKIAEIKSGVSLTLSRLSVTNLPTQTKLVIESNNVYIRYNTYTVTFNVNGGDALTNNTKTVTYNSTYGTLPTPTRTGYTFNGWYTAASDGTKITDTTKVTLTADQTLYAHWTANAYTIAYTLNSGTHGTYHPTSGTYNTAFQISNPTRMGYTFAGWTASGLNTSTAKYGTTSSPTTTWSNGSTKVTSTYFKNLTAANGATVTLTANWTANTYKLEYTLNEGAFSSTASHPTSGTYDTVLQISNPTRTGYTFAGWTTSGLSTGTAKYGTTNNPTAAWDGTTKVTATYFKNLSAANGATVTLIANWTINLYKVTIQSSDTTYGTVSLDSMTLAHNTTITVSGSTINGSGLTSTASAKSATGHTTTFDGWYIGTTKITSSITITGATTITAKFSRTLNTYTITLTRNVSSYGTLSRYSVLNVPYGTTMSMVDGVLTLTYPSEAGGTSITITATPAAKTEQYRYEFSSWSGAGTVTASKTVTANFTRVDRTVNYTVTITRETTLGFMPAARLPALGPICTWKKSSETSYGSTKTYSGLNGTTTFNFSYSIPANTVTGSNTRQGHVQIYVDGTREHSAYGASSSTSGVFNVSVSRDCEIVVKLSTTTGGIVAFNPPEDNQDLEQDKIIIKKQEPIILDEKFRIH